MKKNDLVKKIRESGVKTSLLKVKKLGSAELNVEELMAIINSQQELLEQAKEMFELSIDSSIQTTAGTVSVSREEGEEANGYQIEVDGNPLVLVEHKPDNNEIKLIIWNQKNETPVLNYNWTDGGRLRFIDGETEDEYLADCIRDQLAHELMDRAEFGGMNIKLTNEEADKLASEILDENSEAYKLFTNDPADFFYKRNDENYNFNNHYFELDDAVEWFKTPELTKIFLSE